MKEKMKFSQIEIICHRQVKSMSENTNMRFKLIFFMKNSYLKGGGIFTANILKQTEIDQIYLIFFCFKSKK